MKFATCNEPWRDVAIEDVFRRAAHIGYVGVELAPFTLAPDVRDISPDRRREIARAAQDCGLSIVGLHWLFVSPPGLHLTAPDAAARLRAADYLRSLADFCADVGGEIMTLGSPKQRSLVAPTTQCEAWKRARDVLAAVAPECADRKVRLCIEALGPKETDFINTLDESSRLADEIGSPWIDIMLDLKAMSSMPGGPVENVRRFGARARHFHVNQGSGKGVGMPPGPEDASAPDLRTVLAALQASGYDDWVSCEPFDYTPDPDTVAEAALKALNAAMPA